MLIELIRLLEKNQKEVDVNELSQTLGVQPNALTGMLETLIRKGRVIELGKNCGVCDTCAIQGNCDIPQVRAKHYRITDRIHS